MNRSSSLLRHRTGMPLTKGWDAPGKRMMLMNAEGRTDGKEPRRRTALEKGRKRAGVELSRFLNLKSENLSLRVLSGKQIDDLLDRSVGFFISGLEFTGGSVAWGGFTVKEAVG